MSCVLKCPAVRHTADVIDERATRPLVETFSRVSHNSHSFAPFSKAELTHTNWGFCSGNGPMKGGRNWTVSVHPSNMFMKILRR